MNSMKEIRIEKVTFNVGAGRDDKLLQKSIKLLELVTGTKVIKTVTSKRIPGWSVRPGLALGCKTTIRGKKAEELLKRMLEGKENLLKTKNFDDHGNFSFGIPEYISIPDMKYDPDLGMLGFELAVTLTRPGFRIKKRRLFKKKVPQRHSITQKDAIEFVKKKFGTKVE
jgi:large subunit ribosomal protein L5